MHNMYVLYIVYYIHIYIICAHKSPSFCPSHFLFQKEKLIV